MASISEDAPKAAEAAAGAQRPGTDLPRRLAEASAAAFRAAQSTGPTEWPEVEEKPFALRRRSTRPGAATEPESKPMPFRTAERTPAAVPSASADALLKRSTVRSGEPIEDDTATKTKHPVRTLVLVVVIAAAIALVLRTFVIGHYYIPSASMEKTLHGCTGCNNDHVLVDKLSYKMHDVHRGDVVVFHRPATWAVPEKLLIKRVIGLPGDELTARGSLVYVNGLALLEPYVDHNCAGGTKNFPPTTVPSGEVFVMGDNRCDSSDSRVFGPVRTSAIVGRAFVIIWPLGRIHWI